MATSQEPLQGEKPLVVRRGRVDSVDLYEVKENELELLEKGSPATLQLNFAIFLLSMAFSSIVALLTTEVKWPIVKIFFVVITVVGILLGLYLLLSWWKTRTSIKEVIKKIKDRIPQEPCPPVSSPVTQSASAKLSNDALAG